MNLNTLVPKEVSAIVIVLSAFVFIILGANNNSTPIASSENQYAQSAFFSTTTPEHSLVSFSSPREGEKYKIGAGLRITWRQTKPGRFNLKLVKDGVREYTIEEQVHGGHIGDQYYYWKVGSTSLNDQISSGEYRIKADGFDGINLFSGRSDLFTIMPAVVRTAQISFMNSSSSKPNQIISIDAPDQLLGVFEVNVKNEPIIIKKMVLNAAVGFTNVSVYTPDGKIVAGPVDASSDGSLVFTDAFYVKEGTWPYTIKGKVSKKKNNSKIGLSFNPYKDGWEAVGAYSGRSLGFRKNTVNLSTMTLKGPELNVSATYNGVPEIVVPGSSSVSLLNINLSAQNSAESIVMPTLSLIGETNIKPVLTNLSNCILYDGTVPLNTGANVMNPIAQGGTIFTFDKPFMIATGTSKTITLKCNVSADAVENEKFGWSIPTSGYTAVGILTGQTPTITVTSKFIQYVVVKDSSVAGLDVSINTQTPSLSIVEAGSQDVLLNVLAIGNSTKERVRLDSVGLRFGGSARDVNNISKVSIWDGLTKIGEGVFTNGKSESLISIGNCSGCASSTTINAMTAKMLQVKADLVDIGIGHIGVPGALLKIEYDHLNPQNTSGVALSSGSVVKSRTTRQTISSGSRIMKTTPIISQVHMSNSLSSGRQDLLKFKITAGKNQLGVAQLAFKIATSTSSSLKSRLVSNLNVYAYRDSLSSQPVPGIQSDGAFSSRLHSQSGNGWSNHDSVIRIGAESGDQASTTVDIAAGQTVYFVLRGDVEKSGLTNGVTIVTTLLGDSNGNYLPMMEHDSYLTPAYYKGVPVGNFIWRPYSTTTSRSIRANDYANGFQSFGLSSLGFKQILSK